METQIEGAVPSEPEEGPQDEDSDTCVTDKNGEVIPSDGHHGDLRGMEMTAAAHEETGGCEERPEEEDPTDDEVLSVSPAKTAKLGGVGGDSDDESMPEESQQEGDEMKPEESDQEGDETKSKPQESEPEPDDTATQVGALAKQIDHVLDDFGIKF